MFRVARWVFKKSGDKLQPKMHHPAIGIAWARTKRESGIARFFSS
jgi:hypothetical protein